jgi:hypothetical protein
VRLARRLARAEAAQKATDESCDLSYLREERFARGLIDISEIERDKEQRFEFVQRAFRDR